MSTSARAEIDKRFLLKPSVGEEPARARPCRKVTGSLVAVGNTYCTTTDRRAQISRVVNGEQRKVVGLVAQQSFSGRFRDVANCLLFNNCYHCKCQRHGS